MTGNSAVLAIGHVADRQNGCRQIRDLRKSPQLEIANPEFSPPGTVKTAVERILGVGGGVILGLGGSKAVRVSLLGKNEVTWLTVHEASPRELAKSGGQQTIPGILCPTPLT